MLPSSTADPPWLHTAEWQALSHSQDKSIAPFRAQKDLVLAEIPQLPPSHIQMHDPALRVPSAYAHWSTPFKAQMAQVSYQAPHERVLTWPHACSAISPAQV